MTRARNRSKLKSRPIAYGLSLLNGRADRALITPTDPVAASPIVTGQEAEENIPEPIRHAISFESGANDGLGSLLVFLPFLILTRPEGDTG